MMSYVSKRFYMASKGSYIAKMRSKDSIGMGHRWSPTRTLSSGTLCFVCEKCGAFYNKKGTSLPSKSLLIVMYGKIDDQPPLKMRCEEYSAWRVINA